MRILVCIRQGLDGEINPFDACAYEEALRVKDAEVVIISMGPLSVKDFLLRLTRLGTKRAILLSDRAFSGADTLATAYTLSLAVKRLAPDYVFCGRQTLVGDTAQTGAMLSVYAEMGLVTNVMSVCSINEVQITCKTRDMGEISAPSPALITVERINSLRLPSIRSKMGEVEIWSANDIEADVSRCGLAGSPTRVLETKENSSGRRRCTYIDPSELSDVIFDAVNKLAQETLQTTPSEKKLKKVISIGEAPLEYAKTVCDNPVIVPISTVEEMTQIIKNEEPDAVIWASDSLSKQVSAQVAAKLNLGLCADCTSLSTDGESLFMVRPALAGSVVARIKSQTIPAMATVRTTQKDTADILVGVGYGARENIDKIKEFAEKIGAEITATRKMVDNDYLPYDMQVGLTGRMVAPSVYVAVGISGAVHHIVGIERSGTIIAINPDKDAPIFDYADYGIVASVDEALDIK